MTKKKGKKRIPVAREGWPFVLGPAAVAAGLWLTGHRRLAAPFAAASLASLGFFRDPEREVVASANTVLAPADGTVREVVDDIDEWVGPAVRVSIFLSPLNVHINRAPIGGLVAETDHQRGRFLAAWKSEASRVNERCVINFQGDTARVTVVQIAGMAARRIVCRVRAGDKVAAGDRIGMIRFGSRTDCLMPRGTDVRVRTGQRVVAGMTVLGLLV
ncbi:MAG TPA: phosphatidylserine decarboxylase [Gemmatimonadales bacterium]|nr:phosphatidylserine decarboxylase [Gemmatimonadales bacterium]